MEKNLEKVERIIFLSTFCGIIKAVNNFKGYIMPEDKPKNKNAMLTVNKLDNRLVAEHNDLIKSTAKMTTLSLKLFEIAVSAVDSKASPQNHTVKVNKREVFKALNITGSSRNQQLTKALNTLRKSADFEVTLYDKEGVPKDVGISPIYAVQNNYSSDMAELTFAPEILPFITDLKKNFTSYQLKDILKLDNKYAASLYRWFTMNYRQYQYYLAAGTRSKSQIDQYKNPLITIKKLRKLTDTEKKYKRFADLKRYVLKPTVEGITANTKYNVSYDAIRNGRAVTQLRFHISDKNEKRDVTPVKEVKVSLQDFLQNRFSQLLIGAGLLDMTKVTTDEAYRSQFVNQLYPSYAAFVKRHDIDTLKTHLDYVSTHKKSDIKNIVSYLLASVMSYGEQLAENDDGNTKKKPDQSSKKHKVKEPTPIWLKLEEKLGHDITKNDATKIIDLFGKDSPEYEYFEKNFYSKVDLKKLSASRAELRRKLDKIRNSHSQG